jgi:predicted Ser/Thr protein kinase
MGIFKKLFGYNDDQEKLREKMKKSKEPWVDVINVKMQDKNDPSTGYFELDWNTAFVEQLVESGYSGRTEEEIVEQWFNDLCRGVVSDTMPE